MISLSASTVFLEPDVAGTTIVGVLDPQFFCEIAGYHLPEIPPTWRRPRNKGRGFPAEFPQHAYTLPEISSHDSLCWCCSGNKPARILKVHCHASWYGLTREEKTCLLWHDVTERTRGHLVIVFLNRYFKKISRKFCARLQRKLGWCNLQGPGPR